jgi:hypothetical protein
MKKIMESWRRKNLNEKTVNVSAVWRSLLPPLQEAIAQFMNGFVAQQEVEGLEALDQEQLVEAMTKAAVSEVSNALTNREAGAVKARDTEKWRGLEREEGSEE